MRTLIATIVSAFVVGCASLQGSVQNNQYTSRAKSFSCTLPITGKDVAIEDYSGADGESLRVSFPYVSVYRIENFAIGGHDSTKLPNGLTDEQFIQQFSERLLPMYSAGPKMRSVMRVVDKIIVHADRKVRIVILRYSLESSDPESRGFLFTRSRGHAAVMQFGHWNVDEPAKVESALMKWRDACSFSDQ